jgi:CheY-like chemotaxis protein
MRSRFVEQPGASWSGTTTGSSRPQTLKRHQESSKEYLERIDLLICDLVLSGLRGLEAASMLLAHSRDMKVL